MLRPEPMVRILVIGPKDSLDGVIEALHDLKLVHLIDYKGGEDRFSLGEPLEKATKISEELVKLRSISSILRADKVKKVKETALAGDLRQSILTLELNIREEDGSRKNAEALVSELSGRISELEPFAEIGLSMDTYSGYRSLEVIIGRASGDLGDLEGLIQDCEVFRSGDSAAIFVAKEKAEATRDLLLRRGFSALAVPVATGDPRAMLAKAMEERARWQGKLREIDERLEKLREKYAGFVLAAERQLGVEIEKAEAPLRFATSEHTFVIDGWVPSAKFDEARSRLQGLGPVHMSKLEEEREEIAPTLLRNSRPVRHFEAFLHTYSTPSYKELDPTIVLAMVFPFFFGFMIGDAGYGAMWLALGGLAVWKLPKGGFKDLMFALTLGGFFSLIFGLFLYGEAFGMPFIAENPGDMSWEASVGIHIPIKSVLHKLENPVELMLLSVLMGFVHLTIGFSFGAVNEWRHNRKHSIAKIAWIAILTGLLMAVLARSALWPGFGRELNDALFGWVPGGGMTSSQVGFLADNPLPYFSLGLIIGGALTLIFTEGLLALVEIMSLFANLMSYLRLAGVGMAKAATASAFNVMILMAASGGGVNIALALLLAFIFHMIVFTLGAVTASIQAIRLNYVECFLKFFKGNGTMFRPFGVGKVQEV